MDIGSPLEGFFMKNVLIKTFFLIVSFKNKLGSEQKKFISFNIQNLKGSHPWILR